MELDSVVSIESTVASKEGKPTLCIIRTPSHDRDSECELLLRVRQIVGIPCFKIFWEEMESISEKGK